MPSMPPRSTKAPKSLIAVTTPGSTAPSDQLFAGDRRLGPRLLLQQRAPADHQVDAAPVLLVLGDAEGELAADVGAGVVDLPQLELRDGAEGAHARDR